MVTDNRRRNYIALSKPISEELGLTKAEVSFFMDKNKTTLADILSTPPQQILPINQTQIKGVFLEKVAIKVRVREVVETAGSKHIELKGFYFQKPIQVFVFQKYWAKIIKSALKSRKEIDFLCVGKITKNNESSGLFLMANYIDFYKIQNRTLPLYVSSPTQNEKYIKIIKRLLSSKVVFCDGLDEYLDFSANDMIYGLHNPESSEIFNKAIERFLLLIVLLFLIKRDQSLDTLITYDTPAPTIDISEHNDINKGNESIPFELSDSQMLTIRDILSDIQLPKVTYRYVLGDVGSGKSIVAFKAMSMLANNNCKVVLIAPTVILAEQHFQNFITYFPELKQKTVLLTGSTKGQFPEDFQVLIGTHAVFSYKDYPAYAVFIDEPQKFGLNQQKWETATHYFFMTATPLPRWTSLLLNKKIPVNLIAGRQRNITNVVLNYDKNKIMKILGVLPKSEKKIIVVPWISAKRDNYFSLFELEEFLNQKDIYPLTVHGRKSSSEQAETINKFKNSENDLLLSSSVIEAGLDIVDVKYMIVISPESFGNLGLYQLLGRAGRNGQQSYAYLLTTKKTSLEQFTKFVKTGYDAAKLDLKMRGAGRMGLDQSGMFQIPYAEMFTPEIMEKGNQIIDSLEGFPEKKAALFEELIVFLRQYFN